MLNELRLLQVYKGGYHVVYHIVTTGQHVAVDAKGNFFRTEPCWHSINGLFDNPRPAVVQMAKET